MSERRLAGETVGRAIRKPCCGGRVEVVERSIGEGRFCSYAFRQGWKPGTKMELHHFALIFLPPRMKQIEYLRSATILTILALLLFVPCGRTVADELPTSTVAALFSADEDVLSENTDIIVHAC